MAIQTLELRGEPQAIDREELSKQLASIAEKRTNALRSRDELVSKINKPAQLESQFVAEQRFFDREREHPTLAYAQLEQRRQKVHDDCAREIPIAKDEAAKASAELSAVDAEIVRLEAELAALEREVFDRETVALAAALPKLWTAATRAQECLDAHLESGRGRGYRLQPLGVFVEPHPSRSGKTVSEDVRDYLDFVRAATDPKFAEGLAEDSSAKRKLRAASVGAGLAGLALKWG